MFTTFSVTNYRIVRVLALWPGPATKVVSELRGTCHLVIGLVRSRQSSVSSQHKTRLCVVLLSMPHLIEAQINTYFRLYFDIISQNLFFILQI